MALEKYKICPACGEHNPPSLLECRKCETDLTGVKVMDSAMEQQMEEEKKNESSNNSAPKGVPTLVRVCECGAHNLPQARKCKECGEDISDIIPTTVMEEQHFAYTLQAVGDEFSVTLDDDVIVIGRESGLKEYLGAKMYVSRQHAKITIVEGKVFIENLSNTNHTFINNAEVKGSEPTELHEGDEIGLGGMEIDGKRQNDAAYFLFNEKT